MAIHESLAQGRWFQLTLAEQLANVGSEFHRASKAFQAQNSTRFNHAADRMLELINLTASDPRWFGPKTREITRLKESMCTEFWGDAPSIHSQAALDRYFTYFAIAARKNK